MPGESNPLGQRRIYLDANGGAYPEATPGAGPRHHDDMPADPESMMTGEQRRDVEDDLQRLVADDRASRTELREIRTVDQMRDEVMGILGPDGVAAVERERASTMDGKSFTLGEPASHVIRLVIGQDFATMGLVILGVYGDGNPQAVAHASNVGGVVVELPIAHDYRRGGRWAR